MGGPSLRSMPNKEVRLCGMNWGRVGSSNWVLEVCLNKGLNQWVVFDMGM